MIPFLKALRRQGVASPYGPVLLSCAVFLVAWLFPPGTYSDLLHEPDYMFLDVFSFVFFFLCVASFLFGLRVSRVINPATWTRTAPSRGTVSPFLYFCIPLAVGCVGCVITLIEYGAHVNFIMLLASQQGSMIKDVSKTGETLIAGFWAKAPVLLTGIIWWSQLRLQQVGLARSAKLFLTALWFLAFALDIFTFVALVDRTALIPMLTGVGLISLYWRQASGRLRLSGAVFYGGTGGLIVVAFFLVVAFLRGNTAADLLVSNFLGYSVASYNRFAAVLHGQMRYFYAGKGVYLFPYLENAYFITPFVKIQNVLNWPIYRELYNSEFASVALAGLNTRYIWSGVFGYLYADLGWGALFYVFCSGILTGYLWMKLKAGSTAAVVLYPWVASWIVLWNSWNLLFNDDFVHLLSIAFLLAGWDKIFLVTRVLPSKVTRPELSAQVPRIGTVGPLWDSTAPQ